MSHLGNRSPAIVLGFEITGSTSRRRLPTPWSCTLHDAAFGRGIGRNKDTVVKCQYGGNVEFLQNHVSILFD